MILVIHFRQSPGTFSLKLNHPVYSTVLECERAFDRCGGGLFSSNFQFYQCETLPIKCLHIHTAWKIPWFKLSERIANRSVEFNVRKHALNGSQNFEAGNIFQAQGLLTVYDPTQILAKLF